MIIKANGKDITQLVGGVTLDSNVDTLGDQLNFNIAYSQPFLAADVNVGDLIQLFDGEEAFRGIVVTKTNSLKSQEFACFDFAFYLNKSKVIKQFKKVRADTAIRQLLSEFNVPVGYVAPMSVVINKIFYDKEVSAAIREILDDVAKAIGKRYVMEMNAGKLEIYADTERLIRATVKLADNLPAVDCFQVISDPTKTASIEDMRNSIKLYVGGEGGVKVYAEAKDSALISRYGLLQETQSLDDKDIAKARNIAQNLLKQLGKVSESAGITVLGSFDLRAGRVVVANEPTAGIVGKYKIKSASHNIGTVHTTTLDMEAI